MKIIISPAKQMKVDKGRNGEISLKNPSQVILAELQKLDQEDLGRALKIKGNLLDENYDRYQNFFDFPSYHPLDLYNGMAYKALDQDSLDEKSLAYLDDHLVILSAFYGPTRTQDLIKPYRLDFLTKLKPGGDSLKNLWLEDYNAYFKEEDVVINLASQEFSSLLDRKSLNIIDFEFYKDLDGQLKKHSTTDKKARGLMVRYMALNKIEDLNDLKKFNLDGFSYDEKLSQANKLVFKK